MVRNKGISAGTVYGLEVQKNTTKSGHSSCKAMWLAHRYIEHFSVNGELWYLQKTMDEILSRMLKSHIATGIGYSCRMWLPEPAKGAIVRGFSPDI